MAKRRLRFLHPDGAMALYKRLKYFDAGKIVLNIAEIPYKCPIATLEFVFMADWFFTVNGVRDKVDIEFVTPLDNVFTKNPLRNIRNINFALEQLKNLIDFARAIEPLLKSAIPQRIGTFDAWEQRGLFRLVTEVPEKIDFSRSREVGRLGLMQAMGDREVRAGMGALLEMARGLSALTPEQSVG